MRSLLLACLAVPLFVGCGSNDCLRMAKAANRADDVVKAAPALDVDTPWTDVGEAQQKAAKERTKLFREAAAKSSFSGVILGPTADLGRALADAYRGVAAGYDAWMDGLDAVGAKKDAAVSKARAAVALVQAFNAVCLAERPDDLPEPPPVPYGVPPKLNFIPCSPADLTAIEGAMKTGKDLAANLAAVEQAVASSQITIDKPKDYIPEALEAYQAQTAKGREAIAALQEAAAAVEEVEASAASLEQGASLVKKSMTEISRVRGEIDASCGL